MGGRAVCVLFVSVEFFPPTGKVKLIFKEWRMGLVCLERTYEPRPLPLKGVVTRGESKHKIKESLSHVLDSATVEKGRTCS